MPFQGQCPLILFPLCMALLSFFMACNYFVVVVV